MLARMRSSRAAELAPVRLAITPAQGWLTLVLVAAMCLSLAWSLDDAILVLGDPDTTDFLSGPPSVASRSGRSGRPSDGAAGRPT